MRADDDGALRLDVIAGDLDATRRFADDLALALRPGDVVALHGDLGAGKSEICRQIIRRLADDPTLEVPSPTFTLVQTYALDGADVAHFDLYRLADVSELEEIGFHDAMVGQICLVEWPDRAGEALAATAVHLSIDDGPQPDARRLRLEAGGAVAARIARSRAIRALLEGAGHRDADRCIMAGDASARRYERVVSVPGPAVVMDWPRRPPQPPLRDGLSYPELVHVQDDLLAFTGVAAILAAAGLRVPAILAADRARGLALLEDLGRSGILDGSGRPDPQRYAATLDVLAAKDTADLPATVRIGDDVWQVPAFDRRAMEVELSLLPDWYLPHATGRPTPDVRRAEFAAVWSDLLDRLGRERPGLLLRDVIAANVLWVDGAPAFLDFQDAMIGPRAYDAMSLLTDVRLDIDADLAAALRRHYARARAARDPSFRPDDFEASFAILSAQRNSKILGGFARLARRDGRPAYLAHLPRTAARLREALDHPVLAPLRLWYERHCPLP